MATSTQLGFRKPIGHSRVTGASVRKFRKRIDDGAKRERRAIYLCAGVGLALNALVLAIGFAAGRVAAHLKGLPGDHEAVIGLEIGVVICGLMLLVAAATKTHSRADQAREILRQSLDSASRHQNVEVGVGTSIALIIALYGSYSLVEALKRSIMRLRLAVVDRDEAARLLAQIFAAPGGTNSRDLLTPGQRPESLRGPIALLMLDGWIDVTDNGSMVVPRSPAMRNLSHRHPLADVFQPGE